jgi:hypothetical protein
LFSPNLSYQPSKICSRVEGERDTHNLPNYSKKVVPEGSDKTIGHEKVAYK